MPASIIVDPGGEQFSSAVSWRGATWPGRKHAHPPDAKKPGLGQVSRQIAKVPAQSHDLRQRYARAFEDRLASTDLGSLLNQSRFLAIGSQSHLSGLNDRIHIASFAQVPHRLADIGMGGEVHHRSGFNQFSVSRPGTRLNSARLSVTTTAPNARPWAAIHKSFAPIGVPWRSRWARILA